MPSAHPAQYYGLPLLMVIADCPQILVVGRQVSYLPVEAVVLCTVPCVKAKRRGPLRTLHCALLVTASCFLQLHLR
jgi:hypothetical protein